MLTVARAREGALKIRSVPPIVGAACDFQSRLGKQTKMDWLVLSDLKNRKEKEAAGRAAAQTLKTRRSGGGRAGEPEGGRGTLLRTAPGLSLI